MHPRDKHKGSDLDTNQKLLTENDKRLYAEADGTFIQLSIINQIVVIDNQAETIVALPPIKEADGKTFIISVKNTGNAITLTDYPNTSFSDSDNWGGDYTLDTADDSITLKAVCTKTGGSWTVVSNDIV